MNLRLSKTEILEAVVEEIISMGDIISMIRIEEVIKSYIERYPDNKEVKELLSLRIRLSSEIRREGDIRADYYDIK